GRLRSGDSVDAGLRVFREADHDRLVPSPHPACLDRARRLRSASSWKRRNRTTGGKGHAGHGPGESAARPLNRLCLPRNRRCGVSWFGARRHPGATPLPSEGPLPGFDGATGWLNSPPLTAEDLRGKVVVADFWTYTCINWLRTLAYVRAWSEKYRDRGLVVVGVHTPEFLFEREIENVREAARAMRVEYPIALDS